MLMIKWYRTFVIVIIVSANLRNVFPKISANRLIDQIRYLDYIWIIDTHSRAKYLTRVRLFHLPCPVCGESVDRDHWNRKHTEYIVYAPQSSIPRVWPNKTNEKKKKKMLISQTSRRDTREHMQTLHSPATKYALECLTRLLMHACSSDHCIIFSSDKMINVTRN